MISDFKKGSKKKDESLKSYSRQKLRFMTQQHNPLAVESKKSLKV